MGVAGSISGGRGSRSVTGPAVLAVCASPTVGSSTGLAAALAVAVARLEERSALLVEVVEGHQSPRQPTLLASAAARSIENCLHSNGVEASSRGHLCSIVCDEAEWRELGSERLVGCARPSRAVFSLGTTNVAERLQALDGLLGACVLVTCGKAEESLGALFVSEMFGQSVSVKVTDSVPGPVASRRALAGVRPGGPIEAWSERVVSHLISRAEKGEAR